MKEEKLLDIKRNYERIIKVNKEIEDLERAIELYEQKPVIQKYLELKTRLMDIKPYGIPWLSEKVINDIGVSNKYNIYVCMGAYRINPSKNEDFPSDFIVSSDDPSADYIEYAGVEQSESNPQVTLLPNQREEFEQNNTVLYPPKGLNSASFFNEVREALFKTAIIEGQEKALEKIMSKYDITEF